MYCVLCLYVSIVPYILSIILFVQDKPYHFEEAPALHEHLIKFHFLDTDVLYDVSLQREPRYGKGVVFATCTHTLCISTEYD